MYYVYIHASNEFSLWLHLKNNGFLSWISYHVVPVKSSLFLISIKFVSNFHQKVNSIRIIFSHKYMGEVLVRWHYYLCDSGGQWSSRINQTSDVNRIEDTEDVKFRIFVIVYETFLEQSTWICKWVSWWSHRLTIFYAFYIYTWKIGRQWHQRNHLFIWLLKKCFDENYGIYIFLTFYPIYIRFVLLCSQFFILILTWLKPGPTSSFKLVFFMAGGGGGGGVLNVLQYFVHTKRILFYI